jgi:hypothetical protein
MFYLVRPQDLVLARAKDDGRSNCRGRPARDKILPDFSNLLGPGVASQFEF